MTTKKRPIPIGVDDFKKLRENDYCYVDKSLLIHEILSSGSEVTLFTRPRRFGKTLNMSMMSYFFDCNEPNSKPLFKGLKIEMQENGKYLQHMNKYPVFSITLKNLEFENSEIFFAALNERFAKEFEKFRYLLDSNLISIYQKEKFRRISSEKATRTDLSVALQFICEVLEVHHKEKVFLFIDEYDSPIHSAFQYGKYDECISFMKSLYGNALKGNKSLNKAVLTGILRVAKESIFSDLNNVDVHTVASPDFTNYFGLTEEELKNLLKDYELDKHFDNIKYWYNGYQFGQTASVYNPWSILSWLRNSEHEFQPYWINTSSNYLVRFLFLKHKEILEENIFKLLSGENIRIQLSNELHFPSLNTHCTNSDYFTLLLHSGYLTVNKQEFIQNRYWYTLTIPNEEIKGIFVNLINLWIQEYAPNLSENLPLIILESLRNADLKTFQTHFSELVLQVMSYQDFAKEPENAFHCFTAGFLSWLTHEYEVKSNRETGHGRADIYLLPRNHKLPGYIFELKAIKTRKNLRVIPTSTVTRNLNNALKQIEENNYTVEFKSRKIKNIIKIAMVFHKKKVWFKVATN